MSSNIQVQRVCEHCHKAFVARTTRTRYCSHACNSRAYKVKIRDLKIEVSNDESLQTIIQPVEFLKAKPYLSVNDTCSILGISKRTLYRMLERGDISAGKAGRRTLIQRTELDKLFTQTNNGNQSQIETEAYFRKQA